MINMVVTSLQFINFIALIVLFTNLNPKDMPRIVQNSFTIYWLLIVCSIIFALVFRIFGITGDIEIGLRVLFTILKLVCLSVISIKMYANIKNLRRDVRLS